MKIICAGMKRSGSTWLYNVVRTVTGERSCFEDQLNHMNIRTVGVVKTHRFSIDLAFGADKIFVSHRDLRDVAASAVLRGMINNRATDIIKFLFKEVEQYNQWRQISNYDMKYEEMIEDKYKEVAKIIQAIRPTAPVNARRVYDYTERIKPGRLYNPNTLLWPDHFTRIYPGYYKDVLATDTIKAIETLFRDYMIERGYLCGS